MYLLIVHTEFLSQTKKRSKANPVPKGTLELNFRPINSLGKYRKVAG